MIIANTLIFTVFNLLAAWQDIRTRKIKNKFTLVSLLIAIATFIINYLNTEIDLLKASINLSIIILLVFYLYTKKYLGAGDGKFMIISIIFLVSFFNDYPSFLLIGLTFFTFYLYCVGKSFTRLNKNILKNTLKNLSGTEILITLGLTLAITLIRNLTGSFNIQNPILIISLYIIGTMYLYNIAKKKLMGHPYIVITIFTTALVLKIYFGINIYDISFVLIYTSIRVLGKRIFGGFIKETSYKKIPPSKLKEGMILFKKQGGLEKGQTLSKQDLSKLKNKKEIYIENELPFSLFIIAGNLITFIWLLIQSNSF